MTKFIRGFLDQHPEEIASQRQSRAIWWDKPPQERTPPVPARHAPKTGGAEYTFRPLSEPQE
ncbi:MAG TPA: DUF3460 family protein [Burkholderiales bacterium]|nr:DUF3460 family protein [Burkholderiales bacterium]